MNESTIEEKLTNAWNRLHNYWTGEAAEAYAERDLQRQLETARSFDAKVKKLSIDLDSFEQSLKQSCHFREE